MQRALKHSYLKYKLKTQVGGEKQRSLFYGSWHEHIQNIWDFLLREVLDIEYQRLV